MWSKHYLHNGEGSVRLITQIKFHNLFCQVGNIFNYIPIAFILTQENTIQSTSKILSYRARVSAHGGCGSLSIDFSQTLLLPRLKTMHQVFDLSSNSPNPNLAIWNLPLPRWLRGRDRMASRGQVSTVFLGSQMDRSTAVEIRPLHQSYSDKQNYSKH